MLHDLDACPEKSREHLTSEQRDTLKMAAVLDEQIFAQILRSGFITEQSAYQETRETELWFRKGLKKLFPGHADRMRYYTEEKILVIIDKKFGRIEVESAEDNDQLQTYAVMGAAAYDCERVVVAIVQPRLTGDSKVSVAEYSRAQLQAAKEDLLAVWDACHQPDAPRKAGLDWCKYCKAKLDCPEYTAQITQVAKPENSDLADRVGELADADLDKIWLAIKFAEGLKDKAKEEITKRMAEGRLQNYKLQPTGKMTKIIDPVAAIATLQGLAGLSQQDVLDCTSISLDKVATKLRLAEEITEKDAKIKVKDILGDLLEIKEKSPTLKRSEDFIPSATATVIEDQPQLL